MIGKSILFITVKDVECEPGPDSQVPRYYGTILSMMRLQNKGQAHAIHGMIEFEDFPVPEHTAPKTGLLDSLCSERGYCYNNSHDRKLR